MKIGVAGPPLFGTGPDPVAIRDFAQTVEGLGFNHYGFAERIVQNDVSKLPEFAGRPANYRGLFNEVFTLMCFLAGVTNRIELMSCILILPIRPTALVAKQAAQPRCSAAAASASVSRSVAPRSSTRRWASTSTRAAVA